MEVPSIGRIVLFYSLIALTTGDKEIGEYIVDCSACHAPVRGVNSYRCAVRCETQGITNCKQLFPLLNGYVF